MMGQDPKFYEELKSSWGYGKAPKYSIEIEIIEAEESECHQVGDRFQYPEDRGIICPWLLGSMEAMIRVLEFGGTLPWHYEGTPYQKKVDSDGITTEFVRCPDPTSKGIVVKITRTRLPNRIDQ